VAKSKPGKIHAILGRSRRTGRWRLGPKTSVIAMLGSCRLDLRDAQIDGEISKMTASVFLGSVTIVVPPGVEVRPSGMSLLGSASVNVPPFDEVGEPVLIELEWTTIFGRLRAGAEIEPEEAEAAEVPPAAPAPQEAEAAPTPDTGSGGLDEPAVEPAPATPVRLEDRDEPSADTTPAEPASEAQTADTAADRAGADGAEPVAAPAGAGSDDPWSIPGSADRDLGKGNGET